MPATIPPPNLTARQTTVWDRDATDLLGPAFIEIGADGFGTFRFIAVEGDIDGRHVERDGHPAVEFSWVGVDDNDDAFGRGWALLETDDSLVGHIYCSIVPVDTEARSIALSRSA